MLDFDAFLERRLSRGLIHFTREDLLRALSASPRTLTASPVMGRYTLERMQDR